MNEMIVFNNEEFGRVRTVVIDGEPWFAGKDVAAALEYQNTRDALAKHVDDEDKRLIQRSQIATLENHIPQSAFPLNFVWGDIPNRGLTIINESGMYSLIFGSRLPSAKRFKHWVTSEVLPAIRKTGGYKMKRARRIQDAPISEVTALLKEVSSFLREMDKVMRDQDSHPSDIAEEFKNVCDQFGIVSLSDGFVRETQVVEAPPFFSLAEILDEERWK